MNCREYAAELNRSNELCCEVEIVDTVSEDKGDDRDVVRIHVDLTVGDLKRLKRLLRAEREAKGETAPWYASNVDPSDILRGLLRAVDALRPTREVGQ